MRVNQPPSSNRVAQYEGTLALINFNHGVASSPHAPMRKIHTMMHVRMHVLTFTNKFCIFICHHSLSASPLGAMKRGAADQAPGAESRGSPCARGPCYWQCSLCNGWFTGSVYSTWWKEGGETKWCCSPCEADWLAREAAQQADVEMK